ncbi:unnamed protein product [Leptosia nina]|uniref:Small RNA 2'-O-methyltransferase n=1 Tax=Leptosia nina TaxID=320188 RepID=A0AAV1JGZ5_9NEOP
MIIALQTLIFFRETLVRALDAFLRPYYKNFSFTFTKQNDSDDEGSEDQVYAEYHEEKGVVFFPPVYVQRYAAVTDCLMDDVWYGKLEKVADFGYHDMSFIKYLKEVPGIQHIMGVDIETIPIQSSSDLLSSEDYMPKRENPLKVTLFQGNAADPDYRLIGCDAVIAIEMIEHMLPHDLDRFVQTVFGFIKPWVVVLTTPNGDFNVLFKSMEKNGLRRLDHFFEWSREQYHDWCTNIVLRYPQYSVSCKGIGPGPPDTAHLGCCSQMAIFVSKNYIKQQDLDPNSLALVASKDVPSLSLDDMTSSYECIPDNNMLCITNELNCTTLQVKKFSKTTQNMMAKNKIDSLVHTREVVDEIRHLTKMLNFDKSCKQCGGDHILHNFNWGENAPYWNEYYKVVRDYNYPFETKSDECRILDLICEEINSLVDKQWDDEFPAEINRLEIPIDHLMKAVVHITDDVDKVKELLEWNGYQIVGDLVVHSRLIVDTTSIGTHDDDWADNETVSDWDTSDVRSSSLSDGSTNVPDFYGLKLFFSLYMSPPNT